MHPSSLRHAALFVFLSGALLLSPCTDAQSVNTPPVGFIKVPIAPAVDAATPSSTIISVPLYGTVSYTGVVSAVNDAESSISAANATWTASQFASAASPHLVRIKTGTSMGRFFLITAHTTTGKLTIDKRGHTLQGNIAANDALEILPARTLGNVFGTTTATLKTGATVADADNVLIWNGSNWSSYFHNGTKWLLDGSTDNQNAAVIFPDEGIFIVRRDTAPLDLVMTGGVPTTSENSDLPAAGSILLSNRFPVDTTLQALGLHSTPNWRKGVSANAADTVNLWNGKSWQSFYHNGTNWKRSGSGLVFDTQAIPAGAAIFVTRANAQATSFTQAIPYTP